ncbi:unnamed protein product [Oikopleura dioica]|uniref:Uncharacterized protein n=1 Tax=Oikopleura dioica TaxID=34765 RepID=E4XRP2_OIKDI|nr:unnamed protein product [Oikopleura dioica]
MYPRNEFLDFFQQKRKTISSLSALSNQMTQMKSFINKEHLSIHKLLDFIANEDQEKKFMRGKELSKFTLPSIDIYDARISQEQEEKDVVGCSIIGRALGNKLEIFI